MKCFHCGNELSEGDLFCAQCGKSQKIAATGGNFGFSAAQNLDCGSHDTSTTPPLPEKKRSESVKPVIPVIPKPKLVNWKVLGCVAVVLAVIIGGVYAVSEGDFFSGSDSGSSRSRRDRDNRDDRENSYNYDDDDWIYDDPVPTYDPQPSYFDCPGCTNGWHDLCNGSGIYRNYGEAVECSCDDGICSQCDGEGIIYY